MKSKNKLEVLLYRHPLKAERESFEIEYSTVEEICIELGLGLSSQEYFFLDGDTPISDLSVVPQNNKLYIKAILTGEGGDFADEGGKAMAAGAGLTLIGGALIVLGVLTGPAGMGTLGVMGISLCVSGLATVGGGYYLYTYDIDTVGGGSSSSPSVKGTEMPSIKGGRNTDRRNKKVPILLGRHLVFPWFASTNHTYIPSLPIPDKPRKDGAMIEDVSEDTGQQYLNMLLGNTYAPVQPIWSTIQIGEIPITEYLDGQPLFNVIRFQADSNPQAFFPARVTEEYIGRELEYDAELTCTTAKNTSKAIITMIFPKGLHWWSGGSIACEFFVDWKVAGASDATYQPATGIGSLNTVYVTSRAETTARFGIYKEFDNNTPLSAEYTESRQYTFRIRKQPEKNPNKVIDAVYLENIQSFTGTFDDVSAPDTSPILPAIKEKLLITSTMIKATDQLSSTIDNLNYEMINYQPIYTGNPLSGETGPAYWSDAVTRNPASAFLYVLTNTNINKDPILTPDLEDRIDS